MNVLECLKKTKKQLIINVIIKSQQVKSHIQADMYMVFLLSELLTLFRCNFKYDTI